MMNNKHELPKGHGGSTPDTLINQRVMGWGGIHDNTYGEKIEISTYMKFFGEKCFILIIQNT